MATDAGANDEQVIIEGLGRAAVAAGERSGDDEVSGGATTRGDGVEVDSAR